MEVTKNTNIPLVSVIVPCYNHEQYITQCIESIVNQSYKNIELTVIDDGSKDNSAEILKRLQVKYGFNLVLQENMGVALTLNKGYKNYANGKYISPCASDDFWPLDKIEKQVNFMELHPEFPMCFGKMYMVDQYGQLMPKRTKMVNKPLKGGYIFKEIILQKFHPPVNYLFRKSLFSEIGYYKETWAEDFYMNLKISSKYPLGYIDDYVGYYRRSPDVKDHKAKVINLKSIYSHLDSINEYKDSVYYDEAIKLWHLRCFYWYKKYRTTKLLALKGMARNLDKIFDIKFLKSFIQLTFIWK